MRYDKKVRAVDITVGNRVLLQNREKKEGYSDWFTAALEGDLAKIKAFVDIGAVDVNLKSHGSASLSVLPLTSGFQRLFVVVCKTGSSCHDL